MKITLISSSIREVRKSHRAAIALHRYMRQLDGHEVELLDLMEYTLPPFDELMEDQSNPSELLLNVHAKIDSADGLIFISPEYNGGYSPILKNTIDYFPKETYRKKPIGVVTASSGKMAGTRAAHQLQLLVLALKAYPCPQMLMVPKVQKTFDEEGYLTDPSFDGNIETFVEEYLWIANAVVDHKAAVHG